MGFALIILEQLGKTSRKGPIRKQNKLLTRMSKNAPYKMHFDFDNNHKVSLIVKMLNRPFSQMPATFTFFCFCPHFETKNALKFASQSEAKKAY